MGGDESMDQGSIESNLHCLWDDQIVFLIDSEMGGPRSKEEKSSLVIRSSSSYQLYQSMDRGSLIVDELLFLHVFIQRLNH